MKATGVPIIRCTACKVAVRFELSPGVPADLDPSQNGPPGPNPLGNMDRGVHIR